MEVEAETRPSGPEAEEKPGPAGDRKALRRLEFFWLCGRCAPLMTLAFNRRQGVVVIPVRRRGAIAS